MQRKLKPMFETPDFLISNRIVIVDKDIQVKWYTPEELKAELSFFRRMITDTCELANIKNSELYEQVKEISETHNLRPIGPIGKYIRG